MKFRPSPATALALLVLTGASLLMFGETLFSHQAFFFRDVLHYYWQSHKAVADAWRSGSLPQWNASPAMGGPLLGDLHAGVLYPANALYLLLSFPRAYAGLLVLHHIIGAAGVWAFLKQVTKSPWASVGGALVFMLSGYVVSLSSAGALMAGAALVPWVLVAMSSALSPRKKVAAISVLVALQALCGDPQSVLFSALAALPLVRRRERETFQGFALGLLLAAVQLLPGWYALKESTRAVPNSDFLADWTLHPIRLFEILFPFPYGNYVEAPWYWAWFSVHGPSSVPFALSVYLGASTLLLAVAGLKRDRWTGFALSLFLGGLLLALGTYAGLGPVHAHLPPFRFFRYPEKYVLLVSLGWAVLVGLGIARLQSALPFPRRRWWVVGSGGIVLLGAVLYVYPQASKAALFASLLSGGAMLALCVPALVLARRKRTAKVGVLLVLVLMVFDLISINRRIVWTEDLDLYLHRPAVVEAMLGAAPKAPWRFLRDTPGLNQVAPRATDLAQMATARAWELLTLKSNLGGVYGLDEVSGYGAVELRGTYALLAQFSGDPLRLASLGGGCFIIAPSNAAWSQSPMVELTQAWPALGFALVRVKDCVPRLHAIQRTLPVLTQEESLAYLARADFDPTTMATVQGGQSRSLGPMEVADVQVQPTRARAHVSVPQGGGFLAFTQSSYPGWWAEVDGQRRPIQKTNVATMGVDLPPGVHDVVFGFQDPGLPLGLGLSMLGALLWLLLLRQSRRTA